MAGRADEYRNRRLGGILGALALTLLLSLGASSAQAGTGQAHALPTMRIGLAAVGPSLNPATVGSATTYVGFMNNLAYGALFHMTPKGKITPGLATNWHYFSTGRGPNKDFEFTLRRNARFSDGSPVTAAAVAGWLNYFAASGVSYNTYLGPKPRIEAKGKYRVQIHMLSPNPVVPQLLSDGGFNWGFVASPGAVANPTSLGTATAGAGPYQLDSSQTVVGDHYTYVPNPYYYDKKAIKFSQVYIKVISNASSRLQALQAGQLDAEIGDATTASAAESSGFRVVAALATHDMIVLQPSQGGPLKDVRVRQALNYALDRKTIAKSIYGKYARPTSEFMTADANPGLENYYPYNPAKAKSLLAAAGYSNGFSFKILSVFDNKAVAAAAQYLSNVGVRTDVVNAPSVAAWLQAYTDYPAFFAGPTVTLTSIRYPTYIAPGGSFSRWGTDPTVYKLYWSAFKQKDPTKQWKAMWARITKQAYFLPVDAAPTYWYYSKKVSGVNITVPRLATPIITEWRLK
jgi:peptide/nickel transport system substrate-binding protein